MVNLVETVKKYARIATVAGLTLSPTSGRAESPSAENPPAQYVAEDLPAKHSINKKVPFCERYDCWGGAGGITTLLLFGTGIGLNYTAREQERELRESCGRTGSCLDQEVNDAENTYRLANAFLIASGVAAITTVVGSFIRRWEPAAVDNNSYEIT